MKSDLVEKASEIVTDPLVLINLVSQRVRQLNSGRSPLIPARPSMGVADIALQEIIEGKIKLVEKQGDKQVVVEERKSPVQTCTPEQAEKVKQVIAEYVKSGPPISTAMELPGAEKAEATTDGPKPASDVTTEAPKK